MKEQPAAPPRSSPELHATRFSRAYWLWVGPLLSLAAQRPLEASDLPPLLPDDAAAVVTARLLAAWAAEVARAAACSPPVAPSAWRALAAAFGREYLAAALPLKPLWLACVLLQAFAVRGLVAFVAAPRGAMAPGAGVLWVCLATASVLGQSGCQHHVFWASQRVGMRARTAAAGAVYAQLLALRAAPAAAAGVTSGALANMLVNDTGRLEEAAVYGHFVWHGLIELAAICAAALGVVGVPALGGVAVTLIIVRLTQLVAAQVGAYRRVAIAATDLRVRLTGEVLGAARAVKMNGWVPALAARLRALRAAEVTPLRAAAFARASNAAARDSAAPGAALATFGALAATSGSAALTPACVFTVLALFNALLRVLGVAPMGAQAAQEARSGVERLRAFLCAPATAPPAAVPPLPPGSDTPAPEAGGGDADDSPDDDSPVLLRGSWTWHPPPDATSAAAAKRADDLEAADADADAARATLRDILFRARRGSLTVIVGPVGSGKSSLLLALLGELMRAPDATATTSRRLLGRVAYAPQEPWILAASVRDNILLRAGASARDDDESAPAFDAQRYAAALDAAALGPDLAVLPYGDATPVGERGVTLSGGQRARVSFARAAYAAAKDVANAVVLLDDPLAAVDAATGAALMSRGVCGLLRGATRLLVTHQRQWLGAADDVAVLDEGRLVYLGPPAPLVARSLGPADVAAAALRRSFDADDAKRAPPSSPATATAAEAEAAADASPPPPLPPPSPPALIEAEERAAGSVTWHTYRAYAAAAGGTPAVCATLFAYVAHACSRVSVDLWLAWWADRRFAAALSPGRHVGIFAALVGGAMVISLARAAGFTAAALRAASRLHAAALGAVLRAPVSFFDATPVGRSLNRFSRDQALLDAELPSAAQVCGELLAGAVAGAVVCAVILPPFCACVAPLAAAFRVLQRRYVLLSREAKRLEAVARSPILSAAAATAAAAPALRAAGAAPAFAARFAAAQDDHNRAHFAFVAAGRWLGVRLDALAAAAVATAAACVVATRDTLPPGLAGMALVSSLTFTGTLQYAVRQLSETENLMTSVERLVAYTALPSEAAAASAPGALPAAWPSAGGVEVERLTVAYRPGAPPALNVLSLSIAPRTKLALLGRTGAGKSTLASAFFRLVENAGCSGRIVVDGVDIGTIGLDDLRARIALIPQEPVLFAGSLRDNLDPFGAAADADVAALLPRLGLAGRAGALGVAARIGEGGDNLSAGERALICLGRALLRASALLICDEATAAVDAACDARIQAAIRLDFAACTVITIAHRLDTIIDNDRVVVLAPGGTLAEQGEPSQLLDDAPDGPFAAMVAATGAAHAAALAAAAREAHALRRR